MNRLAPFLLGIALAVATTAVAHAQRTPVYQSGMASPNDVAKFTAPGLITKSGGLQGDVNGNGVNPFSIKDNLALGLCSNSGDTGAAYWAFCLGHDADGNALLSADPYGGAVAKSLYIQINGVNVPFPGTVAGIPFAVDNTALSLLASTYSSAVLRLDHTAGLGAPATVYRSSASACSLNAGAGDGGSQVPSSDGKCWLASLPAEGTDIRVWGADATGVVDSTAAITAAVTHASCNVVLPVGTFKVTGNIPITQPCKITGAGSGRSVIDVAVATGDIFTLSGTASYPMTSTTFRDFGLAASVVRTANAFVHCTTPNCFLYNMSMRKAAIGIIFAGGATTSIAKDISFQDTVPASVYSQSTNILLTGNVVAVLLENIFSNIEVANINTMPRSCIELRAAEATIISKVELIHCQSILLISTIAGGTSVTSTKISDSFFDAPLAPAGQEAYALELNAVAGVIARTTVTNSWFGDSQHDGIVFKIGGGLAVGFECTGCEMVVNGRYGVNIDTANFTDVRFIGGAAAQNGTANFRGSVNTSDITIMGVSSNHGFTPSPVGVVLAAGSARWTIVNNDFNNVTDAIPDAANCGVECVITGNTGYNPVGASTVTLVASPSVICAIATPAAVYINGGTVSAVYVQGSAGSINAAGLTAGGFALGARECVIIEWTVAPTVIMDKH